MENILRLCTKSSRHPDLLGLERSDGVFHAYSGLFVDFILHEQHEILLF